MFCLDYAAAFGFHLAFTKAAGHFPHSPVNFISGAGAGLAAAAALYPFDM